MKSNGEKIVYKLKFYCNISQRNVILSVKKPNIDFFIMIIKFINQLQTGTYSFHS